MKIKDLEYLNDFYFEPTQTVCEKVGKLEEESKEVIEAHEKSLKGKKSNSDVAQEVLDTIHAGINLLKKMNEEELVTIETEIFKHSVKLGEYLDSGKYKIREVEDVIL